MTPVARALTAALVLAALPAQAADTGRLAALLPGLATDDAATQMTAGFAACLIDLGAPEAVVASFTAQDWERYDQSDAGVIRLEHPASDRTAAVLAVDGSHCTIESISLTTAQAAQMLGIVLDIGGYVDRRIETDAQGCNTIVIGGTIAATVSAGGDDPACTSQLTSAIRFAPIATE